MLFHNQIVTVTTVFIPPVRDFGSGDAEPAPTPPTGDGTCDGVQKGNICCAVSVQPVSSGFIRRQR